MWMCAKNIVNQCGCCFKHDVWECHTCISQHGIICKRFALPALARMGYCVFCLEVLRLSECRKARAGCLWARFRGDLIGLCEFDYSGVDRFRGSWSMVWVGLPGWAETTYRGLSLLFLDLQFDKVMARLCPLRG